MVAKKKEPVTPGWRFQKERSGELVMFVPIKDRYGAYLEFRKHHPEGEYDVHANHRVDSFPYEKTKSLQRTLDSRREAAELREREKPWRHLHEAWQEIEQAISCLQAAANNNPTPPVTPLLAAAKEYRDALKAELRRVQKECRHEGET
jgi:hypothetical protein